MGRLDLPEAHVGEELHPGSPHSAFYFILCDQLAVQQNAEVLRFITPSAGRLLSDHRSDLCSRSFATECRDDHLLVLVLGVAKRFRMYL